jgi:hypothetical protein
LGGGVPTLKENTEAVIVADKETGLEVNADKTKYMVMSRDQIAGQNHKCSEMVKPFDCFRTSLTNQTSVREEIKNRLKPGNARYHSVQNLSSSSLLSKKYKDYDI